MSSAVAAGDYDSIIISVVYDHQVNFALFDRLQLQYTGVTDSYDDSDDEENNDSDTDESETSNTVTDELGREIEYTDENGVKTVTEYDDYDNVIRSATQINGKVLESKKGYTDDGNYQISETNALGKTTSYNYDTQLGLLNKVTDANSNSINYIYNSSDNISKVSQDNFELSYTYDSGDRLSKIEGSSSFVFGYDKFGALNNIKQGNTSLVKYSYNDSYILSKVDYANGQTACICYAF